MNTPKSPFSVPVTPSPLVLHDKIPGNTPHPHSLFATERGSKTGRINLSPNAITIAFPQTKPRLRIPLVFEPKPVKAIRILPLRLGRSTSRHRWKITPRQAKRNQQAASYKPEVVFRKQDHRREALHHPRPITSRLNNSWK